MASYAELDKFLRQHGIMNFTGEEVAKRRVPPVELWSKILPTLQVAQRLRKRLQPDGKIVVNSGYRDEGHNRSVGGKPNSLHLQFNALDIVPIQDGKTFDIKRAAKLLLDDPLSDFLSVGRYNTFIHIDTRSLFWPSSHRLYGAPWRNF